MGGRLDVLLSRAGFLRKSVVNLSHRLRCHNQTVRVLYSAWPDDRQMRIGIITQL